jgi:hypothetical protein
MSATGDSKQITRDALAMSLQIHPVLLFIVVVALVGLGLIIAAFFVRGGVKRAALLSLAALLTLPSSYMLLHIFVPEVVDGRFRTYKALYADIHPGMTRIEVFDLIDRHYPSTGNRGRPKVLEDTPERLGFFMNPETSTEPNCEGIFLKLAQGRVASKSYSAD